MLNPSSLVLFAMCPEPVGYLEQVFGGEPPHVKQGSMVHIPGRGTVEKMPVVKTMIAFAGCTGMLREGGCHP